MDEPAPDGPEVGKAAPTPVGAAAGGPPFADRGIRRGPQAGNQVVHVLRRRGLRRPAIRLVAIWLVAGRLVAPRGTGGPVGRRPITGGIVGGVLVALAPVRRIPVAGIRVSRVRVPGGRLAGRWCGWGSGRETQADLVEAAHELPAVRGAEVGVPAGSPEDQVIQGGGDAVHQLRGHRHGLVDVLVGHRQRRVRGVRLLAGEHLEQHDARGVDIRPRVRNALGYLLRRQVGGGADQHAGLGMAGAREHPGQAEVRDLDRVFPSQQDVLGLDVPVGQPGGVRGTEAAQHALHDVQRLAGAEAALLIQQVAQRAAGHVLHGQVERAPVGALVVHADHVGVRKAGHRPGLTDEPADEILVVGQFRMHDLQRYGAVQPGIGAQIDGGHPARGNKGLNPVPAIQEPADGWARQRRVHRLDCMAAYPSGR